VVESTSFISPRRERGGGDSWSVLHAGHKGLSIDLGERSETDWGQLSDWLGAEGEGQPQRAFRWIKVRSLSRDKLGESVMSTEKRPSVFWQPSGEEGEPRPGFGPESRGTSIWAGGCTFYRNKETRVVWATTVDTARDE